MSGRLFWEVLWERFDPGRPPERSAQRALRPSGPSAAILRDLARPLGTPRVLLCGAPGTGKSTELIRVAEARSTDDLVVGVDLATFFEHAVGDLGALQRLTAWEVGLVVGLALVHAGENMPGFAWDPKLLLGLGRAWKALAERVGEAEPDVPALARRLPVLTSGPTRGGALVTLGGPSQAGSWPLGLGTGRVELSPQDPRVRNLAGLLRRLVDGLRVFRPLLLVLDGLDHVGDDGRVRHLLFESGLLAELPCGQVIAAPFGLRRGDLSRAVGRYTVTTLYNEAVIDPAAPAHHGPGISLFSEIFHRQAGDITEIPDEVLEEPLLRRLAYHSGGRLRDFALTMRSLAERAWDEDLHVVPPTLVASVLDERRRSLEAGLHAGHVALLRGVVLDQNHGLPADPEAQALLADGRLLVYSGDTEWFFPHPLLLLQRVRLRVGSASPLP